MLNHIIQELITKAIEKQTEKIITKKAQKKIFQEQEKKSETVLETKVYHQIRKKFNLSINDYCVVDLIYNYSIPTYLSFYIIQHK